MKNSLGKLTKDPHIYTKNNIIYKASEGFLHLTGYKKSDLIGKSLIDLGVLLKTECQLSIVDIKDIHYLYVFNSDNLPLEVKVSFDILNNRDDKVYYFEDAEDAALRFTLDNFGDAHTNKNGSEAIFSYPDCILLKHDGNYMNTLTLMDITTENPIGKHLSFPNNISNLLKQGISLHEFGVESISSDGVATCWDINIKMINGNRNNKYLVTSFYDVTERNFEKEFIKKQNSDMEIIFDNRSDVINILDKDGNYTYINKVGQKKLSQYIPTHIRDINIVNSKIVNSAFQLSDMDGKVIPFEDVPEQRVLRGEKLANQKIIGTSELLTTYFKCDGMPIYDDLGNIDGAILIYTNIEKDYKIEEYEALKENIENISIFYTSLSPMDFKINYMNEYAFQAMKKQRTDVETELDVIGKNFFSYYRVEDVEELVGNIKKAIENKSFYQHKYEFIEDGKTKYTKGIFQPIFNQNNEVEKIIAIGIDISDEAMANKAMEKLLKAQEEIFINTSHELKTPLSLIFSGSQLLNTYLKKDSLEDFRDNILNINKITIENCYRLTKLINNILDISKIESGLYELNLANYNIVEIIDDMVQSVAEYTKPQGIKVIFDPDVEELIIALDMYKFDRILLNLISNAIKFSNAGEVILIKLVEVDNTVRISVIDEGIGIDKGSLDVIFKKFIQLNRNLNRISEGTGLGLPIAKSMAELHGGSLSVESTLDKGSAFTIELPVKAMGNKNINREYNKKIDRAEVIKYEFSDIYL